MFYPIRGLLTVLGRVMLVTIFFLSAVGQKIPNFNGVVAYMEGAGVPYPNVALVGAIAFLIVGSLLVATGLYARVGAVLLLVFLAAATYYFHDFWNLEGEAAQTQTIQAMKNLAIAGGLMMVVANGGGPMSLITRRQSRKANLT